MARLVPTGRTLPKVVGAFAYAWTPYLAERLLLGQWGLLLAYAALPVADHTQFTSTPLLVPSRDGTGTNAIIRAPANLFPSRFGPRSSSLRRR